MKYIVVLGDGMADLPLGELNGKTPLQVAKKPHIDNLTAKATLGLVKTVPEGMSPGSDVANLSVMGYDPKEYYTGRSPLEAVSMGIDLKDTDVALRCNLVTLSDEEDYSRKTMLDYSSDEITSKEAAELIKDIQKELGNNIVHFYPGISYRHCMVWNNGHTETKLIPPHDISDRVVGDYLPNGAGSKMFLELMSKSYDILKNHPVNIKRKERGLNPANSIWLWGSGRKPSLPLFKDKFGMDGAVISAVDLIKGIGICAGMQVIEVEGATGNIHTNFRGKAEAAVKALKTGKDFVYLHMEAPDECGHRREIDNKIKSIEFIDDIVVKHILTEMQEYDISMLILPDHPTPLSLKTHTSDPVPFILYRSTDKRQSRELSYDEESASKTGIFIDSGCKLMEMFLQK